MDQLHLLADLEKAKLFWKLIVGYTLAAIAVAIFFWGNHAIKTNNARSIASQQWPMINGVVVNSHAEASFSIGDNNDETTYYVAVITYEYVVNGIRYTNDRIGWQGDEYRTSMEEAQQLADIYPTDATVVVHYDPDEPAVSVLDITLPGQPDKIGFGYFSASGAILAIALALICAHFDLLVRIPASILLITSALILGIWGLWAALTYNRLASLLFGFGLASFMIGFYVSSLQPRPITQKKLRRISLKKRIGKIMKRFR